MMKITAYADRVSVAPGETINFMVNCEAREFRADFVRLICGDMNPDGPGYQERVVRTPANGIYKGRKQVIHAGSFVEIPRADNMPALGSFTLQAFIWPTTPERGAQALISHWGGRNGGGAVLGIAPENGGISLTLGGGRGRRETFSTGRALLAREWYFVAASFDAKTKKVVIIQEPLHTHVGTRDAAVTRATAKLTRLAAHDGPVTMAARFQRFDAGRTVCDQHYNGKIDSPRIATRALDRAEMETLRAPTLDRTLANDVFGAWDFSADISSVKVSDLSPHRLHGHVVHMPARGMTGWNWSGEEMNWRHAPREYGAIHFHDDDVYDAAWQVDVSLTVPKNLKSGLYCARLRCGDDLEDEDYVPFAVLPPRGQATAKICFVLPTASYMAYANEHMGTDAPIAQLLGGRLVEHERQDLYRNVHREYGASCYDVHSDGSGVCHSSRLRPILNMRPKYKSWLGGEGSTLWQFNADTHIINWLENLGYEYDVITDEELHYEGLKAIEPYRVVLSSSHPEYHSKQMWDALHAWQQRGGRFMYLGANGWYWRIAYHDEVPGIIEVRRNEDGIRAWEARTGEYYHGFTGEYGGLWRRNGRPPQQIVGTGFTAQGFDISSYYVRKPDSFKKEVRWIMNGVGADERIGDFGLIGGGAAGLELDRADRALGTPPNAYLLASSEDHTDIYLVVCEELLINYPGTGGQENDLVRADLVFYETANGGGVFATSSIAWPGSLAHDNYKNNVSRITKNVLDRFVSGKPLLD
ncbi:MAG: LamG domain-containing protein [Gammaproteobacteria bacterium]|nr:LamG domain-containing protein [Gammaproteobacteria bacterium]